MVDQPPNKEPSSNVAVQGSTDEITAPFNNITDPKKLFEVSNFTNEGDNFEGLNTKKTKPEDLNAFGFKKLKGEQEEDASLLALFTSSAEGNSFTDGIIAVLSKIFGSENVSPDDSADDIFSKNNIMTIRWPNNPAPRIVFTDQEQGQPRYFTQTPGEERQYIPLAKVPDNNSAAVRLPSPFAEVGTLDKAIEYERAITLLAKQTQKTASGSSKAPTRELEHTDGLRSVFPAVAELQPEPELPAPVDLAASEAFAANFDKPKTPEADKNIEPEQTFDNDGLA